MLDWYCEKLNCKMSKAACDLRLALATERKAMWPARYHECLGCDQSGKEIEVTKIIETKVCRRCGVEKALDAYSTNKGCVGGVEGTCKECKRERLKEKMMQESGVIPIPSGVPVSEVKVPEKTASDQVVEVFMDAIDRNTMGLRDKIGMPVEGVTTHFDIAAQPPTSLTIDFTDYPEMLERVLSLAKKEFRTPGNQILYMISVGRSL